MSKGYRKLRRVSSWSSVLVFCESSDRSLVGLRTSGPYPWYVPADGYALAPYYSEWRAGARTICFGDMGRGERVGMDFLRQVVGAGGIMALGFCLFVDSGLVLCAGVVGVVV